MTPITKLFLRTFFITGITFTGIMTAFELTSGEDLQPWKMAIRGIGFGLPMAIIAAYSYKRSLKDKDGTTFSDSDLEVIQVKRFTSQMAPDALMEKIRKDTRFGKMKITETDKGIWLRSGITWKSWGENIRIDMVSEGEGRFEYEVRSKPKVVTTIVDYGKNAENLKRIETLLQ
ncbi:hypothetical protein [Robertkochia sediminum]|uniref:hypothetical protein n=1 Tax=Robertkochia sediminum TaxID=2785326 RepID=UPI0019333E0F|nr:hypothetical protein [Robertkochia sediminum]MBL7472555.1 hypothetical protein [Robertkochia sediminum]